MLIPRSLLRGCSLFVEVCRDFVFRSIRKISSWVPFFLFPVHKQSYSIGHLFGRFPSLSALAFPCDLCHSFCKIIRLKICRLVPKYNELWLCLITVHQCRGFFSSVPHCFSCALRILCSATQRAYQCHPPKLFLKSKFRPKENRVPIALPWFCRIRPQTHSQSILS